MPYSPPPPVELGEIISAALVSLLSGAISIIRRIHLGQAATWLWVISEFLTAILCGYLMFNAYPALMPYLPEWVTRHNKTIFGTIYVAGVVMTVILGLR